MLLKRNLLLLLLILLAVLGCTQKKPDNAHNSQNALDWQGFYQGIIPNSDANGTYTDIELKEDLTFIKRTKEPGEDEKLFVAEGTFTWSKDGSKIVLESDAESRTSTLVVQENRLVWSNIQGKTIDKKDQEDYVLSQIPGIVVEKEWMVTKIKNKSAKITPIGDNLYAYFHFSNDENKFYGFSGCNFFRASFHIKGNELSFTPIASTMMAGPNLEIESDLFQGLDNVKSFEIKGSYLYLSDEANNVIITAKVAS